jgi:hypothetical protein
LVLEDKMRQPQQAELTHCADFGVSAHITLVQSHICHTAQSAYTLSQREPVNTILEPPFEKF